MKPRHELPPPTEPGRTVHAIDPVGYEVVDKRVPRTGELIADCRGPAAWIFLVTGAIHAPQLIVKPTGPDGSYP